jgi:hypothetical protein
MDEKELIKKLNNLKVIKPDSKWKKNYRNILYSQISAGRQDEETKSNLRIVWESIMPGKILREIAKPVWLTSLASVLILIVGVGGVYASKNSKPGDSLYIAKIISEKAQMAMTFNEKEKAKLGLEFATSRAREITQVLKDSGQNEDINNDKLEKLSQNFKKEISDVKNRLSTFKTIDKNPEKQAKGDELEVFGANLGKSNQRMEISEPVKPVANEPVQAVVPPTPIASTTPENLNSPDKALEEAEKLFDEKNYDGTIDKLKEINRAIDQTESGQVKGVSETASSTK